MIAALLFLLMTCPILANWTHIPFDIAMKKTEFSEFSEKIYAKTVDIVGINGQLLYNFFKNLYELNGDLDQSEELKIPKIIHQIWLGSPVPESLKLLQKSWIEQHQNRGWSYKLWTDEDVAQLHLYNQQFYDATDNYGIKSDLARFEILYRYGGVYVDMDHECLNPLDPLHYTYDLYVGIQPLDSQFIQLGNALIGSRPGHPLLKHCIETVRNDWHHKGAPKKTGPVHFTKSFYAMAGKNNNKDIALPAFYFYPLTCYEKTYFYPLNGDNRKSWHQQGAFAVHWWAKMWMPKNYRSPLFRDADNDASTISWND